MQVSETILHKADPQLLKALKDAEGDEILSAILLLGPEKEEKSSADKELYPSQFPSRAAWREALITQRQNQLEREIGDTLRALRDLGLEPYGGTVSRTVVVQEPAQQILTALEISGVRHASLDQSIELETPS